MNCPYVRTWIRVLEGCSNEIVGAAGLLHQFLLALLLCFAFCNAETACAQNQQNKLSNEIDLSQLVELAAQRNGISIEFDSQELRGSVSVRQIEPMTDAQLWELANRLLEQRSFTTIALPNTTALSVVRFNEALANVRTDRIAAPSVDHLDAGFIAVEVTVDGISVERAQQLLSPILSNDVGKVALVGQTDRLFIADLRPRVATALRLLQQDGLFHRPVVRRIRSIHLPATQLVALANAARTAGNEFDAHPLPGSLTATGDEQHLLLVAPEQFVDEWMQLIAELDTKGAAETRVYRPQQFTLDEVSSLIAQTCQLAPPQGAGMTWNIVEDALSGVLVITATPIEHTKIEALMERLAEAPTADRRPMRSFTVRNRSVNEIMAVLERLVERGVLDAEARFVAEGADAGRAGRPPAQRGSLQASPRVGDLPPSDEQRQDGRGTTQTRSTRSRESAPPLELTADEGTNTIIAIGDPRMLEQLARLIEQLDQRQPQVKLEVLVVSLTDADTFDLGVELRKLEVSGDTLISLASLFGLSSGSLVDGTVTSGGQGFSGVVLSPGDFAVVLRALETINDGRSVNLPHILVNNNQSGTLNSVLQEPFVSTNASDTVATTSFAGTQDAGTTVSVRPQIAEGDHLVLEYSVAISNFVGESSSAGIPPPRQQNSLQSIVTIPDGYTIAVGGIEIINEADAVSQVPLLGRIPGLGELFKNRSKSRSRSRFFIFIRAAVLRHGGFEDLKYLSDVQMGHAGVDDGWPVVEPRLIR